MPPHSSVRKKKQNATPKTDSGLQLQQSFSERKNAVIRAPAPPMAAMLPQQQNASRSASLRGASATDGSGKKRPPPPVMMNIM